MEEMLELIPAFGSATRIAGAIMVVHSFSVSVRANSGYITFLEIVVFKAVHTSACEDLSMQSLAAQFTAARRSELIIFLLWPEGDIHRPNFSDSSSQLRRVREMNSPSAARATRSNSPSSASEKPQHTQWLKFASPLDLHSSILLVQFHVAPCFHKLSQLHVGCNYDPYSCCSFVFQM